MLDIANLFPSLRLPQRCKPYFVFHAQDGPQRRAFRMEHLPMGWDAAPLLAQNVSERIAGKAQQDFAGFIKVYLDDFLAVAADPGAAQRAGAKLRDGIRSEGGVAHPRKCAGLAPDPPALQTALQGQRRRGDQEVRALHV